MQTTSHCPVSSQDVFLICELSCIVFVVFVLFSTPHPSPLAWLRINSFANILPHHIQKRCLPAHSIATYRLFSGNFCQGPIRKSLCLSICGHWLPILS